MVADPPGCERQGRLISLRVSALAEGDPPNDLQKERCMGRVVALFISPAAGERMQPRATVRALAGLGLEGDRYALGRGSYSRAPDQLARHVSLIGREAMETA